MAGSVPTVTVDATGIHVPPFADFLNYGIGAIQSVYGADTYLGNDSQDGEWVAIVAQAQADTAAALFSVYQAFSPATAIGTGLSSVVKTNGIARKVPSYSTQDFQCGGVVNQTITAGVVKGPDGNTWLLPSFTIPPSGVITITGTCTALGAVTTTPNTLWTITNPQRGWQTVTNSAAASPGAPIEDDPTLKFRQTQSTQIPSTTLLGGIIGLVMSLANVTAVIPYENTGDGYDANGLPGHSFSLVVTGGDAAQIAAAIALKKGASGTFGTTKQTVTDSYGVSRVISFFRPTYVPMSASIQASSLSRYTAAAGATAKSALAAYVNAMSAGAVISTWDAGAAVRAAVGPNMFRLEGVLLARNGLPPGPSDVVMAFYEEPTMDVASIQFVIDGVVT